ncbi:MAG TPA: hypothetical protein VGL77_05740 [Armatimonadota bacterium]
MMEPITTKQQGVRQQHHGGQRVDRRHQRRRIPTVSQWIRKHCPAETWYRLEFLTSCGDADARFAYRSKMVNLETKRVLKAMRQKLKFSEQCQQLAQRLLDAVFILGGARGKLSDRQLQRYTAMVIKRCDTLLAITPEYFTKGCAILQRISATLHTGIWEDTNDGIDAETDRQ